MLFAKISENNIRKGLEIMKEKTKTYLKTLCVQAVMVALFVVLDLISIKMGNIKITFGGLPIILCSILYGPVSGMAVGLLGSFLGQLFSYGITATTILWILPAGIRGLSVGLLYRAFHRSEKIWVLGAEICATSLLVTVLNTLVNYIDSVVYGYSYVLALGTSVFRLISSVITAVAYTLVTPLILKAVRKVIQ